jgi:hypothetical protein
MRRSNPKATNTASETDGYTVTAHSCVTHRPHNRTVCPLRGQRDDRELSHRSVHLDSRLGPAGDRELDLSETELPDEMGVCSCPAAPFTPVHRDGRWINEIEGQHAPVGDGYDRKEDAVRAGRDAAMTRRVEHMIHNLNGRIGERNSYGHDPRNIPG